MGGRKPRVLITGVAGFGGRYLAGHLAGRGFTVLGVEHPDTLAAGGAEGTAAAEILPCDLAALEPGGLDALVGRSTLAAVYHLAAIASVHLSWGSMQRTMSVNAGGTLNLLEALLQRRDLPPVLLVGSADQYGAVPPSRQPLTEDTPCRPRSPYALSKLWQEQLGLYYHGLHRWPIFLTRTFNHSGPGQHPGFVCSDFARQIACIEAGLQGPVIKVGNLRAVRDFLDVRDVVVAYRLLLEKGRPGVPYNVASGRKLNVGEILETLCSLAKVPVEIRRDPEKMRPVDIPLQWGNPGRLRRATGWKPQIEFRDTLAGLLAYWRDRLREEAAE